MALEDIAPGVFGQFPDMSGILSPEQMQAINSNAAKQALLASAVTMLGMSGNQRVPVSTGQALGAALGAGSGAYQGSFDNTLKQMMTMQQMQDYRSKKQKQALFEQAIAGAYETTPAQIPMAQGKGSQLEMLSRPEFGGDFATQETVGALKANLPMQKTINFEKLVQAIGIVDPVEAAKLMVKTDSSPEAIKTFEAYSKMSPAQQALFRQFKQSSAPSSTTTISLTEKGLDKIDSERVGEFSQAAASSRMFAQTASTVNSLLSGKGGGELVKVGTSLAKDLGLKNEQVSANDLAQSLATRAAVGVRQPGSGSTSDIEFKAYMSSVPSLSNSEQGRQFMATGAEAFAKRNSLLSDKARELYKKGNYSDASIAQYDNSLGPVIDQKQFDAALKAPGTGNQPKERRSFINPGK
jgi:hypothetical protein